MLCTSTQEYHHGVWTPVGTKVFLVERDDKYLSFLLNYLYKFWNLCCDEMMMSLVWNQKVKKITTKSPRASFIPNSLIAPNVLSPTNLKNFQTVDKQVKEKIFSSKCQNCKDEEWQCKCNPCQGYRKRIKKSQGAQQLSYQSYKYGSNGIQNSCNQWPSTVSNTLYFSQHKNVARSYCTT